MTISQVLMSISLCSVVFGSGLILPSRSTAMPEPQNLLLAQNYASGCREEESLFVKTETKDYWVYICGGDNPAAYVGIEKQNPRHAIRLPLTDYDPQGNYFEASNGDVVYILAKTPRGMFLTVTQGSKELLRQSVLQPW